MGLNGKLIDKKVGNFSKDPLMAAYRREVDIVAGHLKVQLSLGGFGNS